METGEGKTNPWLFNRVCIVAMRCAAVSRRPGCIVTPCLLHFAPGDAAALVGYFDRNLFGPMCKYGTHWCRSISVSLQSQSGPSCYRNRQSCYSGTAHRY
mmetsp:Transcript_55021/g.122998  ORF Transcript_55021/g.122998 Transcript_55021/m.122998 type:complete len:100 (-) Transcript_55021:324-623(-)